MWVSFEYLKVAHIVSDNDPNYSLCGQGLWYYSKWEPSDKPKCKKCEAKFKARLRAQN